MAGSGFAFPALVEDLMKRGHNFALRHKIPFVNTSILVLFAIFPDCEVQSGISVREIFARDERQPYEIVRNRLKGANVACKRDPWRGYHLELLDIWFHLHFLQYIFPWSYLLVKYPNYVLFDKTMTKKNANNVTINLFNYTLIWIYKDSVEITFAHNKGKFLKIYIF